MKFIDVLHRGRARRRQQPNLRLQERIAQYSLRAAWDVKGTPVHPPVREERDA